MKPHVSIITLSWNSCAETERCLRSIIETVNAAELPYTIVVVDNNSHDGSQAMLQALAQTCPQLHVIYSPYNTGYAVGNQLAYAKTGELLAATETPADEYVLVLNSDTVMPPTQGGAVSAIEKLVSHLAQAPTTVGAVTASLREPNGSVQYYMHRRWPTPWRLLLSAMHKRWPKFAPQPVRKYMYMDGTLESAVPVKIEQAAGACILVRRSVVEQIGGLFRADLFPLYYNDVDLSYRLHQHGFAVEYVPDARIEHHKGTSVRKLSLLRNGLQYSYAALWFFKANHQPLYFWQLRVGLILLYAALTALAPAAWLLGSWRVSDLQYLLKTWHVILTLRDTYVAFSPN